MDERIRELAAYATALRHAQVPADAVHECKRRAIDTLGCALGALHAPTSQIARKVARQYSSNPPARIFGTLDASSVEHAAFANGVALRYLDYSDAYFAKSSGHPSDTLAAVLAIGDALRSSGREVIAAAVLAYEVFCNFSDVIEHEQGWDYAFETVVACAVAAGKLMGLTEPQMGHAIALAITPNMPLGQTRIGGISMWKNCAAANAARNGIFAALLAREGVTGPPEALTGKWGLQNAVGQFEWAPFGGRGGAWRVTETHMKFYPAVVHSQSAIAAAQEVRARVDLSLVEKIDVQTYWVANRYSDRRVPSWRPQTTETAHLSVPYIIGAALLDGVITPETYSEARRGDPRLQALLDRMTMTENPEYSKIHPDAWPYRIEVTLSSGQRTVAEAQYWKGHARCPMSDAEVEAKFRQLAKDVLSERAASSLLEKLWTLEALPDIGEVIELTRTVTTENA